MKTILIAMFVLSSIFSLGFFAAAEEKPTKQSAFEKIQALNGDWEVIKGPGEHGKHGGTVSYKVTAAGSAVMETLFGGTDHEMITLYYMDGDDLAMTHYCMLHNRPLMREERQSEPNKLVLKCGKAENAKIESEDHMHQVTYTFVDNDHVKTDWVLYKGGKPDSTHSFELARKKTSAK